MQAILLALQGYPSAWVDLVPARTASQLELRPRLPVRVPGHTQGVCDGSVGHRASPSYA